MPKSWGEKCRLHAWAASGTRKIGVGEGAGFNKYGAKHKALRAGWARKVAGGGGSLLAVWAADHSDEPFDLGHDDYNPFRWTGPEHRRCNRATSKKRVRSRGW